MLPTVGARPSPSSRAECHLPAPQTAGRGCRTLQRQGPVTVSTPSGRAAPITSQGRGISGARRLDQNRPLLKSTTDRVEDHARNPGTTTVWIPVRVGFGTGDRDRHPLPKDVSRDGDLVGPTRMNQGICLDRSRESTDQQGRTLLASPDQQNVAGVWVGRARFGVQVITVVPHGHETQISHRSESGGSCADDHTAHTPGQREELPIARGRPSIGPQRHVMIGTQHLTKGSIDTIHIAAVGHADQYPSSTGVRRCSGLSQHRRPVIPGGGGPDGTRSAAVGKVRQERCALLCVAPGHLSGGKGRTLGRHDGRGFCLSPRMPRRNGQTEHVRPGPGVASGDLPSQFHDLRSQNRLGTHNPAQRCQLPAMRRGGCPANYVAGHIASGKPNLHPGARTRGLAHRRRHGVVELAIEVRQGHVDQDPGNRIRPSEGLGYSGRLGLCSPSRRARQTRQLQVWSGSFGRHRGIPISPVRQPGVKTPASGPRDL